MWNVRREAQSHKELKATYDDKQNHGSALAFDSSYSIDWSISIQRDKASDKSSIGDSWPLAVKATKFQIDLSFERFEPNPT